MVTVIMKDGTRYPIEGQLTPEKRVEIVTRHKENKEKGVGVSGAMSGAVQNTVETILSPIYGGEKAEQIFDNPIGEKKAADNIHFFIIAFVVFLLLINQNKSEFSNIKSIFHSVISNMFNYKDVSSVRTFWTYTIISILSLAIYPLLVTSIFGPAVGKTEDIFWTLMMPWFIYLGVYVLSSLSLVVRRLRDAGYSPWIMLLNLIPYLGALIILFLCSQKSIETPGQTKNFK